MFTFNVGKLINKSEGSVESFKIDERVDFKEKDEPKLVSNITCSVQFLKLPHEINVSLKDLHVSAQCVCSRCLKEFIYDIDIPSVEREFIIDLPASDLIPGEDVFYIDATTNKIDLFDMIREEILLHFPVIPICSLRCKGLCDKCGINLNEEKCKCKHDEGVKKFIF